MATIKNIGIKCNSRSQARELAKTLLNGRVIDLAKHRENFVDMQITCQSVNIAPDTTRWIVLHDHVLNLCSDKGQAMTRRVVSVCKNSTLVKHGNKNTLIMNKRQGQKWAMFNRKAA